ncbi:hypothetical protein PV04_06543 [Phialophora macrospora]|uniref:Holocytochrome c-type synthase n=1 Tax=Phialophora macrospora TaxID=1851006 RepID=A0A0D2FGT4_9EURO|nr:hypothetical protein PV04_06543 [Phialophora macrospora]
MGWWKADPIPEPAQLPQSQPTQNPAPIPPHPIPVQASTGTDSASASACPVDPKTRAIWLQQAQQIQKSPSQAQIQGHPDLPPSHPPVRASPASPSLRDIPSTSASASASAPSSVECSSDRIEQDPSSASHSYSHPAYTPSRPLSHDRVVSSIPRATPSLPSPSSSSSPTLVQAPANSESETGTHSSGNWIYPSEAQFFHAVMRKQTLSASSPETLASSISSIIPIHNAVNERAWALIKEWESRATEETSTPACAGPKLLKFQGLGAGARSPKARILGLCGYTAPFDRHDWTVERCDGQRVEYVIDFYQGKGSSASSGPGARNNLNFYLDVRPKLNTIEGWRMRAEKFVGLR